MLGTVDCFSITLLFNSSNKCKLNSNFLLGESYCMYLQFILFTKKFQKVLRSWESQMCPYLWICRDIKHHCTCIKSDFISIFSEMTAKRQVQQQAYRWCSETRLTTHGGAVVLLGSLAEPGHRWQEAQKEQQVSVLLREFKG